MARTRRERVEQWRDHVDELCHEGEHVEHRTDLADATVAVTNQRVLVLTADSSDGAFRHVDRPNVGTVTVETSARLRHLCAGLAAAFVGVGVLGVATNGSVATPGPAIDLEGVSVPGPNALTRLAERAVAAVETILVLVEWSVLLVGVAALALAVGLVGSYLRSRSRRLVLRVSGGDDLVLPVANVELDDGAVADLERAIRPGSASELAGAGRSDGDRAGEERRSDIDRTTGGGVEADESG
ncbi:hypothetical protein [Natrinema pallidum]|uniref:Uncharacterized protein n=1 Tax=Natrinema pallidum DSM 3751 TaxID=1227495 RepID=L9YYM9_9EURY|nr:hypothetical protein [Natrinema pallidum]ELY78577.1 hypothetical protein C487_08052 [Natrinema pallidum DSM 3751]